VQRAPHSAPQFCGEQASLITIAAVKERRHESREVGTSMFIQHFGRRFKRLEHLVSNTKTDTRSTVQHELVMIRNDNTCKLFIDLVAYIEGAFVKSGTLFWALYSQAVYFRRPEKQRPGPFYMFLRFLCYLNTSYLFTSPCRVKGMALVWL
jgi:hypothetical protein